ncbi:Carnitine O-acetyltransferase mitochondrial, partial [Quaeritorhiza haematococci]
MSSTVADGSAESTTPAPLSSASAPATNRTILSDSAPVKSANEMTAVTNTTDLPKSQFQDAMNAVKLGENTDRAANSVKIGGGEIGVNGILATGGASSTSPEAQRKAEASTKQLTHSSPSDHKEKLQPAASTAPSTQSKPTSSPSLPLLPVPNLEDSCKKYLRTVRPFLTQQQYESTKNAVAEFLAPDGVGHELQRRLLERAEQAARLAPGAVADGVNSTSSVHATPGRVVKDPKTGAVVINRHIPDSESDESDKASSKYHHHDAKSDRRSIIIDQTPDLVTGNLPPTRENWLIDWWNQYAYLDFREPVVLNVNYFFVFPDDPRRRDMCTRAASIVQAAMQFRGMVVDGTLPPDKIGRSGNMCMRQYDFMFNACRIPKKPSDYVAVYDPSTNTHVAVVRKNQFFVFDLVLREEHRNVMGVVSKKRRWLTTLEIESQLRTIVEIADQNASHASRSHRRTSTASTNDSNSSQEDHEDPIFPIGMLTCDHRDSWADNRTTLLNSHHRNATLLEDLESSVFLVCLDDTHPITREEIGRACWHGDGCNRWFDKSLQFVVFENGKAGFNGEHSMMDATPTSRLCEYIAENLRTDKIDHGPPTVASQLPPPRLLHFYIPPHLHSRLHPIQASFHKAARRKDFKVLRYTTYGKGLIKKFKVSPDAYTQMAIQLAYYKMFGCVVPTYESAGMRGYAWGRTETCRSVSDESVAFVRAMEDPYLSDEAKVKAIRAAITSQSGYMVSCLKGNGIDRHLLGLRLSLFPWEPSPAIFLDPAYKLSSHWTMSTSQVPANELEGYGWGEVVPDGFGIAYMVREGELRFNIVAIREVMDGDDEDEEDGDDAEAEYESADEGDANGQVAEEKVVEEGQEIEGDGIVNIAAVTSKHHKKSGSSTPPRSGSATTSSSSLTTQDADPTKPQRKKGGGTVARSKPRPRLVNVDEADDAGFFWAQTKATILRHYLEEALDDMRTVMEKCPPPTPEEALTKKSPPASPLPKPATLVTTEPQQPAAVVAAATPTTPAAIPVLVGVPRSDSQGLSLPYPQRKPFSMPASDLSSGSSSEGGVADDSSSVYDQLG